MIKPEFGPLESFQQRDENKRLLAIEKNIQFIVIPYWWDQSIASLKQYILSSFPQLIYIMNHFPREEEILQTQ